MNYRQKPVTVQALRYTGDNAGDIIRTFSTATRLIVCEAHGTGLIIHTLEGTRRASVGDYIIRGVKGECYPCKPDIFEATYEPADPSAPAETEKTKALDGPALMARDPRFTSGEIMRFAYTFPGGAVLAEHSAALVVRADEVPVSAAPCDPVVSRATQPAEASAEAWTPLLRGLEYDIQRDIGRRFRHVRVNLTAEHLVGLGDVKVTAVFTPTEPCTQESPERLTVFKLISIADLQDIEVCDARRMETLELFARSVAKHFHQVRGSAP